MLREEARHADSSPDGHCDSAHPPPIHAATQVRTHPTKPQNLVLCANFSKNPLAPSRPAPHLPPRTPHGALAQLVEHLHGMQGVSGSNPLRSTFPYLQGKVATRKANSAKLGTKVRTNRSIVPQLRRRCLPRSGDRRLVRRAIQRWYLATFHGRPENPLIPSGRHGRAFHPPACRRVCRCGRPRPPDSPA